jgi:hypothetical protein
MKEYSETITDEYMNEMISKTRSYCIVLLKHGPNWNMQGAERTIWEHGRRNFALKNSGALPIVCPVSDASDLSGVGIFNTDPEQLKLIMEEDPGVKEGIFIYEIHPCRSFPGSALPYN